MGAINPRPKVWQPRRLVSEHAFEAQEIVEHRMHVLGDPAQVLHGPIRVDPHPVATVRPAQQVFLVIGEVSGVPGTAWSITSGSGPSSTESTLAASLLRRGVGTGTGE